MIKNKFIKVLLIILGIASLIIGCVGIILPIVPTTPFLLLTSFCFIKSSEKFNAWFINSKLYKKYLENFKRNKVMKIHSEILLLSGVTCLLIVSMYFINNYVMSIIFPILIFFKFAYFLCFIKPVSKKEYTNLKNELNN